MKNESLGEDEKYNDHEEQSGNNTSDNEPPSTSSISWFRVISKPSYGGRVGEGSSTKPVAVQTGSFHYLPIHYSLHIH